MTSSIMLLLCVHPHHRHQQNPYLVLLTFGLECYDPNLIAPKLAHRSEDIPMLAQHFLARAGKELGVSL